MKRIKSIKLFLFDMDGTLYLGDNLYPFTKELLLTIQNCGCKYLFMTNNSSKSVVDYIKKLERLGIVSTKEDFITSSQATIYYLNKYHPNKILYVCGTISLKKELEDAGFTVSDDIQKTECIVIGNDTELTFKKLEDVCRLLLGNKNTPYIATNPDYVCPTEFGSLPDCGSICDMIYNATSKRPIVIGKPEALMPKLAMEKWSCSSEKTAVIGDRIYTDIKSGINAGALSILVMSGETTEQTLRQSECKPDIVLKDAGEIIKILNS